ncbi:transcriptional repressor [Massospora cicadina]|nr:transcriptional repressor [Massospora cicadina]
MLDKFNVVNAFGHTVSLLSDDGNLMKCIVNLPQPYPLKLKAGAKRYLCNYPNCGKAFSTSGHLSRHHRIHTGEKNFSCLLPQCQSRFSRQDNMMQHYRTHFLVKPDPIKIQRLTGLTLPPINFNLSSTPPRLNLIDTSNHPPNLNPSSLY